MRTRESGVTLLEILVVIGMLAFAADFALYISMDTYRGSNFENDRDTMIAVLQRARALSMNNACYGCSPGGDGKPHGVHIQSDAYVLFEGSSYNAADTNNVRFNVSTQIIHTLTAPSDIIFDQLSGNSATTGDIGLSGVGKTSTTTITADGRITWTN